MKLGVITRNYWTGSRDMMTPLGAAAAAASTQNSKNLTHILASGAARTKRARGRKGGARAAIIRYNLTTWRYI